jgi:hypothetical protein
LVSAVQILSPTKIILYFNNNLRVGDFFVMGGLSTIASLNTNTRWAVQAGAPAGLGRAAFNPTANSLVFNVNSGDVPAGLVGILNETGVITRVTAGPQAPPLFFTDPSDYAPPNDGGPFVLTKTVMSVEHPGLQIPNVIIGSVLRVQRFSLSSAQILALNTVPVQVLPEPEFVSSGRQGRPGPRLVYNVKDITFRINPGSAPYVRGASKLNLTLGPPSNNINYLEDPDDVTALLESTTPKTWIGAMLLDLEAQDSGKVENQPVYVQSDAAITGGNGTLTIVIEYTVLQT